jgi:hypothetical protein
MFSTKLIAALSMLFALNWGSQTRTSHSTLATKLDVDSQSISSVNYVSFLLRQANAWGGIEEYTGCDPDPDLRMPPLNGTLQDGLIQLRAQDTSLNWKAEQDGIVVSRNAPKESFLDTRIEKIEFAKFDPMDKITDALLNAPAVQRRITAQNLTVRSPELGFAQAKVDSEEQLTLENVTLRQALNAVARSGSRPRVWLFRQTTCNGQKTILVQWLVR